MQTIPETYTQAGHSMSLFRREGTVAMYRSQGKDYWEVHRIRIAPPKTFPSGKHYPEREILAGNEDFGEFGWACVTQERADSRFAEALTIEKRNRP